MSAIRNIDGPKDFIFRVLSGVAIGIVADSFQTPFWENFQVFYAISSYF